MSYLGSSATPIPVAFSGVRTQSLSGNGSTSLFTLNRAVTLVTDIEVIVNNVQQSPFDGSYSLVNNGLGLQFSENVSAGTNNIYVIYRDQPMGSLIDSTAVRKTGDTMTGTLTVGGNLLVSAESGGVRTIGAASGTNTTVVLQASTTIGGGPNIELTKDNVAYFDSNIIKFRSTDASLTYGGFDTAGRLTVPNQPCFCAVGGTDHNGNSGWVSSLNPMKFPTIYQTLNVGGHMNGATGIFTCPVAGVYEVQMSVLMGQSGYAQLGVKKNGVVVRDSFIHENNLGSGYATIGGKIFVQCAASDQLTVGDVAGYSGTSLYISAHGSTSIRLVQ
ncbi:hypothetical protein [Flavobacterium sp.]|jgi:hypothetical protein|uniref:C1q-like domain-containing protein n=1 Tax=Flavobacterium sp. TaxID=239 RepID=UPI0037BF8FA8